MGCVDDCERCICLCLERGGSLRVDVWSTGTFLCPYERWRCVVLGIQLRWPGDARWFFVRVAVGLCCWEGGAGGWGGGRRMNELVADDAMCFCAAWRRLQ